MPILETEYNEKAYGKIRFDEGYDEGLEQGLNKGILQQKEITVLELAKDNIPVERIAKYANTTIEEVEKIIGKNNWFWLFLYKFYYMYDLWVNRSKLRLVTYLSFDYKGLKFYNLIATKGGLLRQYDRCKSCY